MPYKIMSLPLTCIDKIIRPIVFKPQKKQHTRGRRSTNMSERFVIMIHVTKVFVIIASSN